MPSPPRPPPCADFESQINLMLQKANSLLRLWRGACYRHLSPSPDMAKPPRPCSPRMAPTLTTHLIMIVIALLHALAVPGYAQNDPIFLWCSGNTNYTPTSQFKTNLDRLLANLSTVPTAAALGHFQSASFGGADAAAYGLAQCRGDVLAADCTTCLNLTASEVVSRCPLRRVAAIRYDNCLLRYSDQTVLGVMEDEQKLPLLNTQNTPDPAVFDQRLMDLVAEITSEAGAGSSRFAVGVKNYSEFGDIYGLAQCTRDLSQGSCDQCLLDLIGNLPRGKIGGQVLAVSCTLRFEISPFFSLSVVPPPPSPPLQPAPSSPPPSPAGGGGSSTGESKTGKKGNTSKILIIVIVSVVAALLFFLGMIICLKRRRPINGVLNGADEQPIGSAESLLFDFETLETATGNFSDANKLGEGGFGPVYMGILPDGQQIAVKRLSRSSGQGLIELRNEVVLIAKLQHRNLVRLLGFCLQEEKMVVYEYLPNKSLDKFLFDPIKCLQLNWERRYKLIEGIARGLLYLHEDSRLRIIHRDLKASNILLDEHMHPKISDFGLAKNFDSDETHGNTSRIAGTFGYMAPEYVMHGQFSTRSDVFSFGVLVLEIVTGRRSNVFHESGSATDLLSYVWYHWNEGAPLRVLDQTIERYQTHEVLRCIHIGLLCIQEDPSKRPNMSTVVLMLSSYSMTLPAPLRSAFLIGGREKSNSYVHPRDNDSTFSKNESSSQNMGRPWSANEVSISYLGPR